MDKYDALIVGGGLAGCFSAFFLAKQNLSSLIIEKDDIASHASGNDRAHLIPYLTHPSFIGHNLYNHAFDYAFDLLQDLGGHVCETLQLPANPRPVSVIKDLINNNNSEYKKYLRLLTFDETRYFLGNPVNYQTALYKKTLVVSPPKLCRQIINHTTVKVIRSSEVIKFFNSTSGYVIHTEDKDFLGKNLVIANSYWANQFLDLKHLPLKKVKGQIILIKKESDLFKNIKSALAYNGYFLPQVNEHLPLLGTTYEYNFDSIEPSVKSSQQIIEKFRKWLPWIDLKVSDIFDTRASVRATTSDRFPLLGRFKDNIYLSLGHGSRGLHTAVLAGSIIAQQIIGQKLNLELGCCLANRKFL